MNCLTKYGRYLPALVSCFGTGLLLAITLFNTKPELDVQDWYFAWVVVGMAVAALLTVAFRAVPISEIPAQ